MTSEQPAVVVVTEWRPTVAPGQRQALLALLLGDVAAGAESAPQSRSHPGDLTPHAGAREQHGAAR